MRTNAVGRTMDGLVGVGGIVGVEGCRINEGRHAARQDLVVFVKARGALGIATVDVEMRHFAVQHKEIAAREFNAPGLKHRPMSAPTRGRAQNTRGICGNLKQNDKCEDFDSIKREKLSLARRPPHPKVLPRTENDANVSRGSRSVLLPSLTRVRACQGVFCFGQPPLPMGSGFFSRKKKAPCLFFSRKTCCPLSVVCIQPTCTAAKPHPDRQLLVPWTRSKLSRTPPKFRANPPPPLWRLASRYRRRCGVPGRRRPRPRRWPRRL